MRLLIIGIHVIFFSQIYVTGISSTQKNGTTSILSRKRRYLSFPEGSSLQLVYCMTQPSLGMGNIFTIGNIVALAWELPSDPMIFLEAKHKKTEEKPPEPHDEHILPMYYDNSSTYDYSPAITDDSPPVFDRNSYSRPVYISRPGESKYYNFGEYNHEVRPHTSYLADDSYQISHQYHFVDPEYRQVYKRTRRDVYGKLKKLLNALNRDGKACILKLICEVSQVAKRKGSFMEEIVKVVFRIKTHDNMREEDEYDAAYNANHNCTDRYQTCKESFFGV